MMSNEPENKTQNPANSGPDGREAPSNPESVEKSEKAGFSPEDGPKKPAKKAGAAREDRLAAALRDNLRRRKQR